MHLLRAALLVANWHHGLLLLLTYWFLEDLFKSGAGFQCTYIHGDTDIKLCPEALSSLTSLSQGALWKSVENDPSWNDRCVSCGSRGGLPGSPHPGHLCSSALRWLRVRVADGASELIHSEVVIYIFSGPLDWLCIWPSLEAALLTHLEELLPGCRWQ